ncbi:dermatopontin-like [Oculina patagonica]
MIRKSTLFALIVVLGLAYVFGEKADTEKTQDIKSSPLDTEPKEADVPEEEEEEDDDKKVNDPKYWSRMRKKYRYRFRYGYRKSRRSRRKRPTPYPSNKPYPPRPTPNPPDCSTSRPADHKWANDWQGKLFFECTKGDSIISVKSVFRDCQNDRIWAFGCGYNEASKQHCHWTHGYANDVRHGINFNCPNHGFLTGIDSIYVAGDRRFKFKCCNDEDFDHANCHQSHNLNAPGDDFQYAVQRDQRFYITGINSYFVPEKRDRVWKIDYCKSVAEHGSSEGYALDAEEKDIEHQEPNTH